ncbi:MAG: tetratricopeptide repeat protein [Pseudomonadota bacterium]
MRLRTFRKTPLAKAPSALAAAGAIAVVAATALSPQPARAVFNGDMSPRAESGDADYAAALRARKAKDWMEMVNSLLRVVERRPWHDNAHSLLGYSYRKMGLYALAIKHYSTALELNPRHRQALEYLGEAYLQMDDVPMAEETMARLAKVCRGVALSFSDGDFSDGCNEYRILRDRYEYYQVHGKLPPEEKDPEE